MTGGIKGSESLKGQSLAPPRPAIFNDSDPLILTLFLPADGLARSFSNKTNVAGAYVTLRISRLRGGA